MQEIQEKVNVVNPEKIEQQVQQFIQGFPKIKITGAATLRQGITELSDDELERHISTYERALISGLDALKFVPASGAASRMFKHLFNALERLQAGQSKQEVLEDNELTQAFFEQLDKFAFYPELMAIIPEDKKDDETSILEYLLTDKGLDYGNLPKGLLSFHKKDDIIRTPFQEHIHEAAAYCTSSKGSSRLHFTVSKHHQTMFEELLKIVQPRLLKRYGSKFDVSFSNQLTSTDTVAVDMENRPLTDEDGNYMMRPGGHGALLENINNIDADIIFVKNIDNVVPEKKNSATIKYKKALAGLLINTRNSVFSYLKKVNSEKFEITDNWLNEVEDFMHEVLNIQFETPNSQSERIELIRRLLDRPIRVCGMVKNLGEPGGGPFFCEDKDGNKTLQIVESAQFDSENEAQREITKTATHFNPVDLICSTKNYKGESFDLLKFRDEATGFISFKSSGSTKLKALELPGLWNGAMSNWNTIFVEVPVETFNPVKTVNDLLRKEHM